MNRGGKGSKYLRTLKNTLKVARFIRENHFDVLHTDMLFMDFQPLLYLFCKPWIITKHDPFPHSEEYSFKTDFYRRLSFCFCKRFVVLNKNQHERFCKTYRIASKNVLINRLGVYDNIKAFVNSKWNTRAHNILFFGRITPYKGIEFLCEAMKTIHDAIPDATLTIAGGGDFYFDISEYERLPYIEIRNHFISMEELAQLVYECSISVCPYKEATQSGVVMSSFSLCKPVVATNVGGLGEMIEDGKSGFVVEPCNPKALAEAVIRIFNNESDLSKMQDYIKREFIEGDKSWEAIAERYLSFYNEQIGR